MNIPNKMVSKEDIADRDFHFAGAGQHPPMTIRAKTVQEAESRLRAMIESKSPPIGAYEADENPDETETRSELSKSE